MERFANVLAVPSGDELDSAAHVNSRDFALRAALDTAPPHVADPYMAWLERISGDTTTTADQVDRRLSPNV